MQTVSEQADFISVELNTLHYDVTIDPSMGKRYESCIDGIGKWRRGLCKDKAVYSYWDV
jgi:hypothetical protein